MHIHTKELEVFDEKGGIRIMAIYTHEAGAIFPNGIIELTNFKNADSSVASLIKQIKDYQAAGNYSAAQTLIDNNKNTLKQYIFDTAHVNRYVEEIRNLEIYSKTSRQQIYYQQNAPSTTFLDKDDVWIGPKS